MPNWGISRVSPAMPATPSSGPLARRLARAPRQVAGAGLLAAALVLVSACGSDEPEAAPASPTDPPPATTTPSAAPTPVVPVLTEPAETVTSVPAPDDEVDSALSVSIPSLDVSAPVIESGVTDDRVLQVPSDPAVLGRWVDGARPGDGEGSVVLAGHVSYRGELGALHTLPELQVGAEVVVETPDGPARYVAEQIDVYEKTVLPYEEIFRFDVPERLVLITCGGEFDRSIGHYDSNVVAYLARV